MPRSRFKLMLASCSQGKEGMELTVFGPCDEHDGENLIWMLLKELVEGTQMKFEG